MAETEHGAIITERILDELRYPVAVAELIRFLESGKLSQITEDHRTAIGNYRSIELDGETFFGNMKNGKGVSSVLYLAQQYGAEPLIAELKDIQRLLAG